MSVASADVGPASVCDGLGHAHADSVLVPLLLLVPTFKSHQ